MKRIEITGTITINGILEMAGAESLRSILRRPVARLKRSKYCSYTDRLNRQELEAIIALTRYAAANENVPSEAFQAGLCSRFQRGKVEELTHAEFPKAVSFLIELTKDEDDEAL